MTRAILLDISRSDNVYRFRLEAPESGASVRQFVSPQVSKASQSTLRKAIEQASRNAAGPFSLEELGRLMHDLLLPPEIQAFLQDLDAPLLLSTDDPEMPWELLFQTESGTFLGLNTAVGRRLITAAEVARRPEESAAEARALLLIGDPREDLPGARAEIAQLGELAGARNVETRTLTGNRATLLPIQLELQNGDRYLGIHFAGHAGLDRAAKQFALHLAGRAKLNAETIGKILRGSPFVFLNACGSDRPSQPDRRAALPWEVTEGLAAGFIQGGARCVIGTRWEVDDRGAAEFALLFYREALQGAPIGEALRLARLRFREARPDDATWAAFILYGDPCHVLVRSAELFLPDGALNRACFHDELAPAFDRLPGEVQQLGFDFIGTPHLLIALTRLEEGVLCGLLRGMGHEPRELRAQLRNMLYTGQSRPQPLPLVKRSFSERARRVLAAADGEARAAGSDRIGEKQLLLGILSEREGTTVELLRHLGVDPDTLRSLLLGGKPAAGGGSTGVAIAPPPERKASMPPTPKPPAPEPAREQAPQGEPGLGEDARETLAIAWQEACRMGYDFVSTAHLFIALTKIGDGYTVSGLEHQGLQPKQIRDALRVSTAPAGPARREAESFTPAKMSSRAKAAMQNAAAAARAGGSAEIRERHLLIGFLQIEDAPTQDVLKAVGVNLEQLLDFARETPEGAAVDRPTPLLDEMGRDITRLAREGKLKPIIGRKHEIEQIVRILRRMEKNNPLLVGEAGVGKTAIVEGLAQRIVEGRVPDYLMGKRIIELPVAALVSGTKYRGDMEERMVRVMREADQPNVILFIDEIHTLMGAGLGEGGKLDIANILKPALARGELRCIGATTLAEFRASIEKDAALERRFQQVPVKEPSPEETLEMLRQTRGRYEAHYKVRILDDALEAAVRFSVAYLPSRRLPDKACDLVDEACARTRVGSASKWPLKTPEGETENPAIDSEAVAHVVAEWTGIPVTRLTEAEQSRLLHLEDLLRRRVVGQEPAVAAVAQAVRFGRLGLKRANRPVAVLLFIGPTGVGKTELAKALAEVMYGSENDMIRLDMSEFGEAHTVSKLVGAPPGFIGHESEGQLTGRLRNKPYSLVLLDEIEKAHPDIFNLFLQLFEDGRLTDSQGRTADGRNTIFILTSNAATDLLESHTQGMGFSVRTVSEEEGKQEVLGVLRKVFSPEFLNRIDNIVFFGHLEPEHVRAIVRMQIDQLAKLVRDQHEVTLEVEDGALDLISEKGYVRQYGARSIQRTIQRLITEPLSRKILEGMRGAVRVRAENGEIVLEQAV